MAEAAEPEGAGDVHGDAVARAREVARALLEGRLGAVEAARSLSRLRFDCGDLPEFGHFVAIDSETDHLPVGRFREQWSREALAKVDADIQRFEDFDREDDRHAARLLLAALGG